MSEPVFRVLVVDDEPVSRRGVVRLVDAHPQFVVAGECGNGLEALEALRQQSFDLVLLDVEMPELNGLEVVQKLGVSALPIVIFVTAYDRYALQAFDAHALDYILKPVDPVRFAEALDRARVACVTKGEQKRLAALMEEMGDRLQRPARLAARSGNRLQLIPVNEIDWIEAADNYVRLHVKGRVVLQRETLSHLADRLGAERFLRVHRSHLVALDRIREFRSTSRGDGVLALSDGTEVAVSRRYRDALDRALLQG